MKYTATAFFFLFLALSCKKEIPAVTMVSPAAVAKKDSLSPIPIADAAETGTELLSKQIITECRNARSELSKSNAVALYTSFREKIESLVGELNNENAHLLDNYYQYYDQQTYKVIYPDSIRTRLQHFEAAKIEIWEIGEGYTEIRTLPDFYTSVFSGYLPKDYEAYLQLEAFDNTKLYAADAGFTISLAEVSQRVLNWENFLAGFPKSPWYEKARETYKYYLRDYIYGLDNTSNFEYESYALTAESKEEFNRFIAKNPTKVTAKVLKAVLASFQRKDTPEQFDAVVKQEMAKYPITL
jgi:hypothetical protein